jgi:formiminotetrahydrofolate cyclodeaminase
MTFREQTIDSFLSQLESKAPVPGGGGASALCGALCVALTHMVAALTVGKPKYASVEAEMAEVLSKTEALKERLLSLMDEDAAAFEPLALAYRMPKETEEQKNEKARVMDAALKSAAQPPMRIMEVCAEAMTWIAVSAEKGSAIAVSDAGVAAALCRAALEGAAFNVFINTQIMADREYAETLNFRARQLLAQHGDEANEVVRKVTARLGA